MIISCERVVADTAGAIGDRIDDVVDAVRVIDGGALARIAEAE